jgi:hypothetical protein
MRPDDVRFASLADIPASNIDVRFAPNPARRKWDGVTVPFVTLEHHIFLDSVSQRAHRFWRRSGCWRRAALRLRPEAPCMVRVPKLLGPRDPARAVCLRPEGSLRCLQGSKPITLP